MVFTHTTHSHQTPFYDRNGSSIDELIDFTPGTKSASDEGGFPVQTGSGVYTSCREQDRRAARHLMVGCHLAVRIGAVVPTILKVTCFTSFLKGP